MGKKYKYQPAVSATRMAAISALVLPESATDQIQQIALEKIQPNPFQPRTTYPEAELESLTASIREHGILQPLIGRTEENGTITLIAGHRRWKAASKAGKTEVPVYIRSDIRDETLRLLAVIENIHREDLHTIDKARGLAEIAKQYRTQADAADALGMKRTALVQWIRVLELGDAVLELCSQIPNLSLNALLRMLPLSEGKRLSEAKRILALSQREKEPTQPNTAKPKKYPQAKSFLVKHPEKKFSFQIHIRPRSRKHTLTAEDYRVALLQALESLDQENVNALTLD